MLTFPWFVARRLMNLRMSMHSNFNMFQHDVDALSFNVTKMKIFSYNINLIGF